MLPGGNPDGEDVDAFGEDVDAFGEGVDALGEGADAFGEGVDAMGEDVDAFGEDADTMGEDVGGLGEGVDMMGEDVDGLGEDVDAMGEDVDGLGEDVDTMGARRGHDGRRSCLATPRYGFAKCCSKGQRPAQPARIGTRGSGSSGLARPWCSTPYRHHRLNRCTCTIGRVRVLGCAQRLGRSRFAAVVLTDPPSLTGGVGRAWQRIAGVSPQT